MMARPRRLPALFILEGGEFRPPCQPRKAWRNDGRQAREIENRRKSPARNLRAAASCAIFRGLILRDVSQQQDQPG